MNKPDMPFPILIGDLGGTNARFSILENADDQPIELPTAKTADFETFEDAVRKCVLEEAAPRPKSAILAIAGPIDGDEVDLTNCPWVVRPKFMISDLGFEAVQLVNDFEAQALAVAALGPEHREWLGGPDHARNASRAILGPGTGLGVAGLVYVQGLWVPVPGEGGHVDLGPRSERDYQLFPHFEAIEGRISAEQLLCGRGLVNLYLGICAADGLPPTLLEAVNVAADGPAKVSTAGLAKENAQAVEALELFATYLGRIAGDLALIFKADGGVFLAGGISQKILPVLKGPQFREAFEDKAPHNELLREMPTFVVTHPMAAPFGLAEYARAPSRFGLNTEGRYWRA